MYRMSSTALHWTKRSHDLTRKVLRLRDSILVKGYCVSVDPKKILRPSKENIKSQLKLTEKIDGLPELKPASQLIPPHTNMTTLSNGLRVASQETYGQSSTIGLFIDAGSRYEDASNSGVSHLLEHLSFKSSLKRPHVQLVRDVEDMGGNVSAACGREQLVYTVDILRDNLDQGLEILSDCIFNPALVPEEIESIKNILKIELDTLSENPQAYVQEKVHEAAYGANSPLGRPLHCQKDQIAKLDANLVAQYMKKFLIPSRMVLAGAGVDHNKLVTLAEKYLKHIPPSTDVVHAVPSPYVGGEIRMEMKDSELSYVALGFETAGWHEDDIVPACVLHTLLGGGDSFSAGGPGKGMYSRLYTSVLNRYYWVESASAFTHIFSDTGILGIYGATQPQYTSNLLAILCNQLLRVANEPVNAIDLSRARNQLKSAVLMNLESRLILYEDIGRQVLTYGERQSTSSLCDKIDAVTVDDILRIGQRAISSPPTLVCYGNLNNFPTYNEISDAFNSSRS